MIVIDTSVAIKWFATEEQDIPQATLLYKNHLDGTETIIIPELLLIEFANTMVTKSNSQLPEITEALHELLEANLHIHKITSDEILTTTKLARKYKTSVYDMLFTVIAQSHKTTLITADDRFITRTRFSFVKHLKDIPLHP